MAITLLLYRLSTIHLKVFVVKIIVFIAYWFLKNKRELSEKNLSEIFGEEINKKQIKNILKGSYYEFWDDTFCLLPSIKDQRALKRTNVIGIKHLQDAHKEGRGVILLESNDFGRRISGKQILHGMGFQLNQVHAEDHLLSGFTGGGNSDSWVRRHIVRPFFENGEKRFIQEIIYFPKKSNSLVFARTLLDRLKRNGIICMAGGGLSGQKFIPIKFLSHSGIFATGIVSLAKMSSAPILPIFCIHGKDGKTNLIIERPILISPDAGRENNLGNIILQYLNLLESYVKKYPEQYRNWHFSYLP